MLQRFAASKHLDESYSKARPLPETEINAIAEALGPLVGRLIIR